MGQHANAERLNLRRMNMDDLDLVVEVEAAAYTHPWSHHVMRGCLKMGYDAWIVEVEGDSWACGYSVHHG